MAETKNYKQLAKEVRRDVLSLIHSGQTSHIASCFSAVDIAVVLYENLQEGDEVVFSKGWASALYYIMAMRQGKINREELFATFPNSPYNALLEPGVPGVGIATGSVGHGLSYGVGLAYAKKLRGEEGKVYVLMSDGEWNEGSVWEAALFAGHHKLDNLVAITDFNEWQALGRIEDVLDLEPARSKWEAFKWKTSRVDGHNFEQLELALREESSRPFIVIADTKKGKGVSFFENPPEHKEMGVTGHLYHYKNLDDLVFEKALAELT